MNMVDLADIHHAARARRAQAMAKATEIVILRRDRATGQQQQMPLAEAMRRLAGHVGDDVSISELRRKLTRGDRVETAFAIYERPGEELQEETGNTRTKPRGKECNAPSG